MIKRADPGGDRIRDMQGIAHLQAVSVNDNRLVLDRLEQEMCDPALIFGSELARPVDAAHAQDRGAQAKYPRIVAYILISRSLGTAIRTVKIEDGIFRHAFAQMPLGRRVAPATRRNRAVVQEAAVDLVGRCEQDRRLRVSHAHCF